MVAETYRAARRPWGWLRSETARDRGSRIVGKGRARGGEKRDAAKVSP